MERDFLSLKWKSSNENVKKRARDKDAKLGYNYLSDNRIAPLSQFSPSSFVKEDLQRKMFSAGGSIAAAPIYNNRYVGGSTSIIDQEPRTASTVDFLNGEDSSRSKDNSSSMGPSCLTIFYGNAVYAYDDISPEKAEDIMRMAYSREASNLAASDSSSHQAQRYYAGQTGCSVHSTAATSAPRTVLQARKASLVRFMEKRRDRYQSR